MWARFCPPQQRSPHRCSRSASQILELDKVIFPEVSAFETSTSFDCIYDNKKGELVSLYEFCFDDGKLTSKASH
jgi:hypothetical protein